MVSLTPQYDRETDFLFTLPPDVAGDHVIPQRLGYCDLLARASLP